MSERESRSEDRGLMKIVSYWPILVCIFTSGAWYQSNHTLSQVEEKNESRISSVENAVIYLRTLVELRETERRDHVR